MNVTQENIDNLNAVLKVELTKEDYLPKVDAALKQVRKSVNLKGFRQGMVPLSLVKKMHGNAVLYDEVNKLVNEQITNHIKEKELDVLGQPLPKEDSQVNLDIQNPEDVTLEFDLGLAPEFDLSALQNAPAFNKYKIKVDDKLVDEEVENLRMRYGVQKDVEEGEVEEGDVIHAEIAELENGEVKEGGVTNATPIGLTIFNDDVKEKFIGTKIGEHVDINLFESSDKDRASLMKFVLDIKEEADAPEGMGDDFRISIAKVGRTEKGDLTEEFFKKIYPDGSVADEAALREKIVEEVTKYFDQEAEVKTKNEIIEYLIENVQMDFPAAFLKRWIKATNEKPITEEQIEGDYENFEKGLRWSLITNKLGADNDIKAEKEDIEAHSKEALRKQLEMYNPAGNTITDEQLDAFNANMMANQEHVKKTYDAVMEQKLFGYINNVVKFEDKEVTLDEFRELSTKK